MFYNKRYPYIHPAYDMGGTDYFVGCFRDCHLVIHPKDSRGMRLWVALGTNVTTLDTTWNRSYTPQEYKSVFDFSLAVAQWLRDELQIPQVEIVQTETNFYGNETEPSMLRVHLICRGTVGKQYLEGMTLRGPNLGNTFSMEKKEECPWPNYEPWIYQKWLKRRLLRYKVQNLSYGEPIFVLGSVCQFCQFSSETSEFIVWIGSKRRSVKYKISGREDSDCLQLINEKRRLPLEEYLAKILPADFPLVLCLLCKSYTESDLEHVQTGDLVDVFNANDLSWYEGKVLYCWGHEVYVHFLGKEEKWDRWISRSELASYRSLSLPFADYAKEACEKAYNFKFKDITQW